MVHESLPSHEHWLRHMPGVERQRQELRLVEGAWDQLSLLSSLSPLSGRASSGGDLAQARQDFSALSAELLQGLVGEALKHRIDDLATRAEVCIDVLVRNLFERTADIGFFATDVGVAEYLAHPDEAHRTGIESRLRAYASKYTVYRNIFLFDPDGHLRARLCETPAPGARAIGADADFLSAVMRSRQPYVEHHAVHGFTGQPEPTLVYAQRVESGGQVVGALCLEFDLADEMPAIFDSVQGQGAGLGADAVLALIDAQGRVLTSSDPLQLPAGWRLPQADAPGVRVLQHLSRRYLLVVRDTHGFQGYSGPGWRGAALLPVDLAFDEIARDGHAALMDELAGNADVLSEELRGIPRRSAAIQSALERSVWNGLLELQHLGNQRGDLTPRELLFAKTLLSEIGAAARRTARAFSSALEDLYGVVTRSMLRDAQSRAALAMQILDRNLYERANDCRWWALTPQFAATLRAGEPGCARASAVLSGINDLYTVYSCLVLFDRQGRVMAVSRPEQAAHVGSVIDEPWVARCLGLASGLDYAVSEHGPNRFSPVESTFVYAAAVRAEDGGAVLGGVAVVWDATNQLQSILSDCASGCGPRDALAFVDARDGLVLAVGHDAPLQTGGAVEACRTGGRLVSLSGHLFGVGVSRGQGYREFRASDGYDHGFTCLALRHLCERRAAPPAPLPVVHSAARRDAGPTVQLATFVLGGHWLALEAAHVALAAPDAPILGAGGVRAPFEGLVQVAGQVWSAVDLRRVVADSSHAAVSRLADPNRQLIVVRVPMADGQTREFALRVDGLGPMVDVAPGQRQALGVSARHDGTPLIDAIVAVPTEGPATASRVLCCLSMQWLRQCAANALVDTSPQCLGDLVASA